MARSPTGQIIERHGKRGRSFGIRFRAYGRRHYLTLDVATHVEAEAELKRTLAAVELGIWQPPRPQPLVEEIEEEPTFHVFSSRWFEQKKLEGLEQRTLDHLQWALSGHLIDYFETLPLSQITAERIDAYRAAKVREREMLLVDRPLGNSSINRTIQVLAQVLDAAEEYGHVGSNPARGRRRRLKVAKPRRTWLELDEVRSLLDAAATDHRPLLATMILAGLRVGEACALRWRDVDLARAKLTVQKAKTDAGRRVVDLSPYLLEELKLHRARARDDGADAPVFPTRRGTVRDRNNVRMRVLESSIKRANKVRAKAKQPPVQDGVTNHTLRRTFASLLYEAGASPAYVMAQMGHSSSALALEVYARKMERQRDTGERMDALVRGADWAQMGTNGEIKALENGAAVTTEKEKAPR
jgi:integrase